jgi:hypothetical protein
MSYQSDVVNRLIDSWATERVRIEACHQFGQALNETDLEKNNRQETVMKF